MMSPKRPRVSPRRPRASPTALSLGNPKTSEVFNRARRGRNNRSIRNQRNLRRSPVDASYTIGRATRPRRSRALFDNPVSVTARLKARHGWRKIRANEPGFRRLSRRPDVDRPCIKKARTNPIARGLPSIVTSAERSTASVRSVLSARSKPIHPFRLMPNPTRLYNTQLRLLRCANEPNRVSDPTARNRALGDDVDCHDRPIKANSPCAIRAGGRQNSSLKPARTKPIESSRRSRVQLYTTTWCLSDAGDLRRSVVLPRSREDGRY